MASCFLARGLDVTTWDPPPDFANALHRAVASHWPALEAMEL